MADSDRKSFGGRLLFWRSHQGVWLQGTFGTNAAVKLLGADIATDLFIVCSVQPILK